MIPILDIERYSLDYTLPKGRFRALHAVSLAINKGEVVGLVGESGSGKTSLAWAIMRHLPGNAVEEGGPIRLAGEDLRTKPPHDMAQIRGRRIGMVFQDPSTALNPTLTLGEQLVETLAHHLHLARPEAWQEGESILGDVGIKAPAQMMRRYPHEASGGEKQRVILATAFACRPELIVFDEPTTALDVITARQILDLFRDLQARTGTAALYISHDLAVVSRVASRVAVIHRGKIVEQDDTARVFTRPQADYTKRLIAAVPHPKQRLSRPYDESPKTTALLAVRNITVRYGKRSLLANLFRSKQASVEGNRAISLSVRPGEILGIVGESGSGKSTLAKAIAGLNPFTGEIDFVGQRIHTARDMNQAYRRGVQIVFQHPDSSLNPRHRVGDIIARPLKLLGGLPTGEIGERVKVLLQDVQLPEGYATRFPHQLSGGEKQRVAIARAFASAPSLVICDEITSSLDVSVQAAVIRLLLDLQQRYGTAYMFITHDLNLVRQIAHRIAVLHRGELVELATLDEINAGGQHPYTRALLDAVPALNA